jgi:F-type H+-transporting ATPase subunit b
MKRVFLLCFAALICWAAPLTVAQSSPETDNRSAPQNSAPKPEASDEESQFKHSPSVQWLAKKTGLSADQTYEFSVVANFAVIAVAVIWLSKKNLPGMFRNRNAAIQRAMQEARKASEEARQRLADIESRLSKLDSEIAEMRAMGEQEAAAEEQRIKASAEEEARRIAEAAGQEIAAAGKTARRELTAYAAELAVGLAAKQVEVDAPTDQALVRHFADNLNNGAAGQEKK